MRIRKTKELKMKPSSWNQRIITEKACVENIFIEVFSDPIFLMVLYLSKTNLLKTKTDSWWKKPDNRE